MTPMDIQDLQDLIGCEVTTYDGNSGKVIYASSKYYGENGDLFTINYIDHRDGRRSILNEIKIVDGKFLHYGSRKNELWFSGTPAPRQLTLFG